jgi:Family of unknown function (DUF6527)
MNTESVILNRVKVPLESGQKTKPGDFAWDFDAEACGGDRSKPTHYIYVHLPGESSWSAIKVQQGAPGGNRVWGWNGNEDKPTLTPSIHAVGIWHGFLTNGELKSC